MSRPPMWLWIVVIGLGSGAIAAELRGQAAQDARDTLVVLEARVARAEAQVRDGCFLTRSPRVVAEVRK